ncbi:MAG TPA: NADH-quinone oxidoreductase subunit J [Bacteroidota bacterium]|nr:NADH-quinone oxidoreductase subunit J [Bacteroidota bacterium]
MNSVQMFDIIFYILAVTVLLSAGVVVFSRNIVYSAFSLLFTFFGVAGLYVLLNADFLAITQLMVYVGGILVLILFGVMLTNKVVSVDIKSGTLQMIPATILAAAVAGILLSVFLFTNWMTSGSDSAVQTVKTTAPKIGEALITTHALLFEVASVVLLVAIIGAAFIARREKTQQ